MVNSGMIGEFAPNGMDIKYGYNPKAGEWYAPVVAPRPQVYHELVKQGVIQVVYPDLVEPGVGSPADIAHAINSSIDNVIEVKIVADYEIPRSDDGKIITTFVPNGKTLIVDLNGHHITCIAYAFYVTGGTLIIKDSKGTGSIKTTTHNTYSAIQVTGATGTCIMHGGLIDTRTPDDKTTPNYCYGVVCETGGTFKMNGGTIHTDEASCISVSNQASIGSTGNFDITGSAHLITDGCAAVYQASMDTVDIHGSATVEGGIVARMGHITVRENAKVVNNGSTVTYPLGKFVTESGVEPVNYGFLAMTGVYTYNGQDGTNDLTFEIKDNATVKSTVGEDVAVATIDTQYAQKARLEIKNSTFKVMNHDELAALATAEGKTLAAKTVDTDLSITAHGTVVWPVPTNNDEPTEPAPTDETPTVQS